MLCTSCAACEEACPSGVPIVKMVLNERQRAFDHRTLEEGHRKIQQNIDLHGRSVAGEAYRFPQVGGRTVLFPGCIGSTRLHEEAMAAFGLLERLGLDPFVPELSCCGAPLEKIGDTGRAEAMGRKNEGVIGRANVVTSCPGCTEQLSDRFDVRHIVEVLHDEIGRSALRFRASDAKVTMHHPCHLARRVGRHAIDDSYDLLGMVPGLKVVEMDSPDTCCGGGGGVMSAYPGLAEMMAKDKLGDARNSGADILLAACPFCVLNLRKGGGMPVEDLPTFLYRLLD